jgi:hypothetical protein
MTVLRDRAAAVRFTTASILAAADTLAGGRVEEERIDEIAYGDTPRLIVFADQNAQTESQGGSAVRFVVTVNLVIQALVQHATLDAARDNIDTIVLQIKTALLCNTTFVLTMENIVSYRIVSTFKGGGEGITGDARIQITGTWREIYQPVPGPPLSAIGVNTSQPGTAGTGNTATIVSQFIPGG